MYLIDYHTHTKCSFDSEAELADMVLAAQAAGLRELCVTDHCDLIDEHGQRVYDLNWAPLLAQFDETEFFQYRENFILRFGLEFGMGHVDPPCSEAILAQPELDFVIGSVHNYSPERGSGDFYLSDMSTPEACGTILEDYFFSMRQLVRIPYFDILGHIIYPFRYTGSNASILDWMDQVDYLLKEVIRSDRGIEVNTDRGRQIKDWIPILKRYRELGGEIVTVGSDAHEPRHVGLGVPEACQLLKSLGFKTVCVYNKHRPSFIDIE